MPKDGLVRLTDKAAASLLLALESLPPKRDRLILKRPETDRAPGRDRQFDYNVVFNNRVVGRVWRYEYKRHPWEGPPWHWYFHYAHGLPATDGHAATLDDAINAFRKAWDAAKKEAASA